MGDGSVCRWKKKEERGPSGTQPASTPYPGQRPDSKA
jgi:hypothetical protein